MTCTVTSSLQSFTTQNFKQEADIIAEYAAIEEAIFQRMDVSMIWLLIVLAFQILQIRIWSRSSTNIFVRLLIHLGT